MKGRRAVARAALALVATLVALVLAEVVVRLWPRSVVVWECIGEDGQPIPVSSFSMALDPAVTPRPRNTMRPGAKLYLRYKGLRRPWLDEDGAVRVSINQAGIRDREEIGFDNPPGQRRVLCLGDSITLGWGIPVEDCWVRRIEPALRQRFGDVRTVNCGFMGTLAVDEYWYGLKHRFHRFQPDMVVVTLCLNDLLVTSGGVAHLRPAPKPSSLELVNRLRGWFGKPLHELDPDTDYVELLLNLPAGHDFYQQHGLSRDMLWAGGTPQRALREMKSWCVQRKLPMVVILWPFLQGLESDQTYPFQKMHDMVRAFCSKERIPFLDLLPALKGQVSTDLWVAPSDQHPNPKAQELVSGAIADFVMKHCGW